MPRGRPAQRPGWAARIVMLIPTQADDRWISASELMDAAGLTYMQVIAAIAWLRDNHPEYPLISSRSGYRFSVDAQLVREFTKWRLRTSLSVMRRCYTGVVAPYLTKVPDNVYGPLVKIQYERLLEDLGRLITSTS